MSVAEFRADVGIIIPAIVEHLKHYHLDVREAVIKGVSTLAVQGMC